MHTLISIAKIKFICLFSQQMKPSLHLNLILQDISNANKWSGDKP